MVCIDLSAAGNADNAKRSAAAGLSEKIIIPGERYAVWIPLYIGVVRENKKMHTRDGGGEGGGA